MPNQFAGNRPLPGVMFGITHDLDGGLIIREPKCLKIGIGLPKGPALNVWIGPDGQWNIQRGYKKNDGSEAAKKDPMVSNTRRLKTRAEAEAKFWELYGTAPKCPYPRKIPYFTFTKPVIEDGQEMFVPDFDAIEAGGPTPTEIDIVLLDDQPFNGAYQMWSSSELKCKGDGVNAMRVLSMAKTPEEKELAAEAERNGERTFPIIDGCWTSGCPFAKESMVNGKPQPSACKPGGDLKFQLATAIRVGGTAYFHTTGMKSISSIFSSLHQIGLLTGGRLVGLPLKMVLRPFKSNHNGQVAVHYAVSLEFRAPDVATMRQRLLESIFEIRELATGGGGRALAQAPVRLIEAPAAETPDDPDDDDPPIGAAAMAAEFYPDAEPEEPEAPAASAAAVPAAAATAEKTAALGDKLRRARGTAAAREPEVAAVAAAAVPVAAAAPAAAPQAMPARGDEDLF